MTQQDVTRLLAAARGGERRAIEQLYAVVYGELRGMAQARLRRERSGHTLQPTALVNEVYLLLVDHARRRLADKRDAGLERVTLADLDVAAPQADVDVVALDGALEELQRDEPRLAEVVTLRIFAGMSIDQTADALELWPATVKRNWTFARAWLAERMGAA